MQVSNDVRIVCEAVGKVFLARGGAVEALRGISFQTRPREFLCIVGASGCGKTTLLRIISRLLEPSYGRLRFEGTSTNGRPMTSMMFQESSLLPWLDVKGNVTLGLELRGAPRRERLRRSQEVLEQVGLASFADHYPHELSAGMKQRVALSRTLVNDPAMLLMDEPLASLDAQTRLLLRQELLDVREELGKPVIYVTHDIDEALLLGDRIMVMTRRPGQCREMIDVPLPRPRTVEQPGFRQLREHIWHCIRQEVLESMQELS